MDKLTQALLALHYITPLTATAIAKLIQANQLQCLETLDTKQLSQTLRITPQRASAILTQFKQLYHVDMQAYYAENAITPIPFYDENYPKSLLLI